MSEGDKSQAWEKGWDGHQQQQLELAAGTQLTVRSF